MLPNLLLAHGGPHGIWADLWTRWTWEPITAGLIACSALLYAAGLRALWSKAGRGRGVRPWQAAALYAGLASIALALLSPLAWLSSILFSAHMTQHEVLMLVSAPLLVFGQPLLVGLWALPASWRERWSRSRWRPRIARGWQVSTAPLVAFLLHGIALWVWHAPRLYEAALGHDGVHALQHASFTVTGVLFWWGMVHGRYGALGYGAAVVYVFLTAVHSSVLGALMTIAPGVWYPTYAGTAAAWRLDPLEDQQLAGLLMWVPSGVVFIVFGLALFAAWLGAAEKRGRLGTAATLLSGAQSGREDPPRAPFADRAAATDPLEAR